jgi:hypothetical protein
MEKSINVDASRDLRLNLVALMKAHELLNSPEAWCQGSPAEDSRGNKIQAFDPRAVKWCALGAVQKEYPSSQWGQQWIAYCVLSAFSIIGDWLG